jgi:hypothetical protein
MKLLLALVLALLPPDASAQSLVLNVAGASVSTPGAPIELCPLGGASIIPEQGGVRPLMLLGASSGPHVEDHLADGMAVGDMA